MILSDDEIRQHIFEPNFPMIIPYEESQIQPASYDLRLGNKFRVFERNRTTHIDLYNPVDITKEVTVEDGKYFTLHPGEFILAHTVEKVNLPHHIVGRVEGKSSLGRLGLFVHITAGFIDPGFFGNITLEMACLHPLPILLYPGQFIAQISFHFMSAPASVPYQGRYQGDSSVAPSRFKLDNLQPYRGDVHGRNVRSLH